MHQTARNETKDNGQARFCSMPHTLGEHKNIIGTGGKGQGKSGQEETYQYGIMDGFQKYR